jgi:hypothetical protein
VPKAAIAAAAQNVFVVVVNILNPFLRIFFNGKKDGGTAMVLARSLV